MCDKESKEIEQKGKSRQEIYALAKNTVNKSCHRQPSLVSIMPRPFFQTFPLLCRAASVQPHRHSNRSVFTLTYSQSLLIFIGRQIKFCSLNTLFIIMTVPTLGIVSVTTKYLNIF